MRLTTAPFIILALVAAPVLARASVKPADLLCVRALTSETALDAGAMARVADHLIDQGFARVQDSNVFRAAQVIAQIDSRGHLRLYFEKHYWPTDWKTQKLFSLLSARDGVLAILPGRDGHLNIIDAQRADAPFTRKDLARPEAQRPMIDQLYAAGFQPVRGAANLLELPGDRLDFLAFLEGPNLVSLFETAPGYVADDMPAAYRIVGVARRHFDNGNYNGPFSEIVVTNGARELTITSFQSDLGRIVRETIVDAIPRATPKFDSPRGDDAHFVIGARNSAAAIRALETLNSLSLAEIEHELRPHASSPAGFLGADESLVDLLLEDNATVLDDLGLTHQQIAEPLLTARSLWETAGYGREVQFTSEGRRFKIQGTAWRGMQPSPFGDKFATNADFVVTNLDTGAKVIFSGLLPDFIHSYGFYEGHGTQYRVDPRDVVRVFDYLQKP